MVTTPIQPELHVVLNKTAGAARDARDTLTVARREGHTTGLATAIPDLFTALDRASAALDEAQRIAFEARG